MILVLKEEFVLKRRRGGGLNFGIVSLVWRMKRSSELKFCRELKVEGAKAYTSR
jgi:hypothetical protein